MPRVYLGVSQATVAHGMDEAWCKRAPGLNLTPLLLALEALPEGWGSIVPIPFLGGWAFLLHT